MQHIVTLVIGLAWPVTVAVLLFAYRKTLARLVRAVEIRISTGDTVKLPWFELQRPDARVQLPSVTAMSSGESTNAVAEALHLRGGGEVLITVGESTDEGQIGAEDALAVAAVQAPVLRFEAMTVKTAIVRRRFADIPGLLRSNAFIISIGGPGANRLTEAIFKSVSVTYSFNQFGVYDSDTGQSFPTEIGDGMNGTDWAIVVFVANPLNPLGRVAVVAGHEGFGTHGAGLVLANIAKYQDLHSAAVKGDVQALVRVPFERGLVKSPKVISVRALQPSPV